MRYASVVDGSCQRNITRGGAVLSVCDAVMVAPAVVRNGGRKDIEMTRSRLLWLVLLVLGAGLLAQCAPAPAAGPAPTPRTRPAM